MIGGSFKSRLALVKPSLSFVERQNPALRAWRELQNLTPPDETSVLGPDLDRLAVQLRLTTIELLLPAIKGVVYDAGEESQ